MAQLPNSRIYIVDWRKLVRWLLPVRLRQPVLLAWMFAVTAPVRRMHADLLMFMKEKLYFLTHNSQVVRMEGALNDVFDNSLRRINIIDGNDKDSLFIFRTPELKPRYIRRASENQPVYIYRYSETINGSFDFVVEVPTALQALVDLERMKALINVYRLPSKNNYLIIFV